LWMKSVQENKIDFVRTIPMSVGDFTLLVERGAFD
jgi:hypothetical protein